MSEEQLPELPSRADRIPRKAPPNAIGRQGGDYYEDAFTADQMREYARAAVRMERERCARICEEGVSVPYPVPPATHKVVCLPELAAAIREGGR